MSTSNMEIKEERSGQIKLRRKKQKVAKLFIRQEILVDHFHIYRMSVCLSV